MQENAIDLILCDIASLPLKAGRELGLPALLLANFTWHDIYSAFPGAEAQSASLNHLKDEYACANLHIQPQCFISDSVVRHREEVGFISLKGINIRNRLEQTLNRTLKNKTVVFVYLGIADTSQVQWLKLAGMENCFFVTRDPVPPGASPDNLAVVDERFTFPDLIASSDVVLTKAGYSTLATAFTHGKPVLSCSREDFCEFEVMKEFMGTQGVGLIIPSEDFYNGRWTDYIQRATKLRVEGHVRLQGAKEVVQIADRFLNSG